MTDWKVILFIALLTAFAGYIWFDNIRWTIRFWRKKSSNKTIGIIPSKIINNSQNDKYNDNPKPSRMHLIEFFNCLKYQKSKTNNETNIKDNGDRFPSPNIIVLFTHIKRIIKRLTTICKQNLLPG